MEVDTKLGLKDVKNAIIKMTSLNDLFFDSVMSENYECYCKYKYVAKELSNYISVLLEYYNDIDF